MNKPETFENNKDEIAKENIQKRVDNLFANQELPAYTSLSEVAAMKDRIQELEKKLLVAEKQNQQIKETKSNQTDSHLSSSNPAEQGPDKQKAGFLRSLLTAPSFGDLAKNRIARLQHQILLGLFFTGVLALIILTATWSATSTISSLVILVLDIVVLVAAFVLQRQGYLQLVSWILVGLVYLVTILSLITGSFSVTTVLLITVLVTLAGLLLKPLQVVAVMTVGIITVFMGPIIDPATIIPQATVIFVAVILGLDGLLLTIASGTLGQSFNEVDRSTKALIKINEEFQDITLNLEQRVTNRTHDLELASEVGRLVTARVDNLSVLLNESVELIRARFNFYYAQVYLTDASGRAITLRAGTGEAGAQLLKRGHHLLIGPGSLNGRAASEKQTVIVSNTAENPGFLPNPLLPKTRSEMAVPLIAGNRVVGVLDIQSEEVNALNEENKPAFEALAGQLAIAIQNATLFNEAEEARFVVDEQIRRLTTSGWQDFLNGVERGENIGFVFDQTEVLPLTGVQGKSPEYALTVPIEITGAQIGNIQLLGKQGYQWTSSDKEIVQSTVSYMTQHIENLRLLSQAEQYRLEAEQIARRLTIEGWNDYLNNRKDLVQGYQYSKNRVLPVTEFQNSNRNGEAIFPLIVRDEPIGEVIVNTAENGQETFEGEIVTAIAEQLSKHIENLRLLEQAETSRMEVQKSQEQYELAVNGSNDGLWDWNITTNEVYFSPRWKAMVGYNEDELMNGFADFEQLLHPDDHDQALTAVNNYLAGKINEYDIEFRFRHKDNSYRWIRARGMVLRNSEGVPYRMAGSHTDITQSKQAEEQLRTNEARLSEALNIAKLGNWEYDVEKDLFTFNDQFYSIFQTNVQEVGGYQISSAEYARRFVHPDDVPIVGAEIEKALSSTSQFYDTQLEHRILYSNGSIGYLSVAIHIERDEHGRIIRYTGANQDITERKQAETAIKESEQRLQIILNTLPTSIAISRISDGVLMYNNTAFASLFGYPAEVLTGKTTPDFYYSPEDRQELFGELNLKGSLDGYELRVRHSDGHLIWTLLNVFPIQYAGENCLLIGAIDVTRRKQIEESLAKRADQLAALNRVMAVTNSSVDLQFILQTATDEFRTLMQVHSAGVLLLDEKGETLTLTTESYADPNMPKLAGRSMPIASNPATNKSIKSGDTVLVSNAQTDPILEPIHAVMKQRNIQSVLVTPLLSRNKVIGVFSVDTNDPNRHFDANDVTLIETLGKQLASAIESIQLFDETKRRAADLSTVAAVSTATSTMLDPDELLQTVVDITKERFNLYHAHIYLADNSWNTLLLAAGAGDVGRQMLETSHAIQMNADRSLVARAAREKRTVIINNVQEEEDFLPNTLLPNTHAEMAIPMIVGETVLGVFDVQSDKASGFSNEDADIYSTLATQVAVALQNARLYVEQANTVAQLRELDRLKSSFLANMSHELRTPLNSILGFTDVMLEELDGPLTENMNTDLNLIQKNGKHLLHLINDVLDMAKIESGKMNLLIEKFNLHEIIEEVISITQPLANEKAIPLYTEPDSDHEVEINADHTRLRQVLINLVNNSIKFTEKGKISIRATRENNNVLISVHDTGIGIPITELDDIFNEFTQVDVSTTRKAGGTGLGLPISRKLIEMHGGRLWAESNGVNGEGSTFYVFIPIESKTTESEPQTKK